MVLQRGDHVISRDRPAIVEGDAVPDLEHPLLGAVGRLEAFGHVAHHVAIGVDLGEAVGKRAPQRRAGELVRIEAGVHRVGGGAMANADLEVAALLGLVGVGLGEHAVRRGQADAGGKRQLGEFTPRDAAPHGLAQCGIEFVLRLVHRDLPVACAAVLIPRPAFPFSKSGSCRPN